MTEPLPLAGRSALVTGVGRRRGIGYAVAARLARMGASIALHQHTPHDLAEYGYADDPAAVAAEIEALCGPGASVVSVGGDLGLADTARELVRLAGEAFGHLDILICNHAHGGDQVSLATLTPDALDRHWAVNARSTMLLTQAFAEQHDGRDGGRVIWMTSGQALGPMSDNLAYAISKAAIAGATHSVSADLARAGILLNTINPGPVNTGYLDDVLPEVIDLFPAGRAGEPDDPARLIGWLVSDEGRWMVGQVLNSEGGFTR